VRPDGSSLTVNENKENLKRQWTVEDTTDHSMHRYSMTEAKLNAISHRYFNLNASKRGVCFVLSSHCGTSNLCHVSRSRENSKGGQLNEFFHHGERDILTKRSLTQ